MTYDIKRTNGSVEWIVKTVRPTGTQGAKAMGENVVDMSFALPVYVDFKINDFVVVYGETYKINLTPSVKKVAKRKYEYQIQFEHIFYDLAKVQIQGLNATNGYLEPVFNIMGNAATIIGLIVENANRHSEGWTVGVVDDTPYQNYSFNAENCLQVLNRLASDNETEFWIDNKTIHLQKREQASGLQFEYGQGKGLYSIYRSNKSSTNILTRLYVRGGSRNLPLDYRDYATSLLLPGGLTYIQDNAKVNPETGYGLIEATIVFENIFPQREGTISAVVAGDDNWDKFTDNSIDFDVNAYKLATPAKVAFNTGQLAGYEFDISDYNHATKQFTIIQNTDQALTVPNNLLRPAVGDKYVLLDIKMPQAYVDAAEAKLLAAAQAYYDKNSDPALNFSYAIDCDPIWFAQQNVSIVLGNTVVIYDVDLGINGAIRIAGFRRDLQIPSKYELEISDSIGANEIVRQYAQQQRTLQLIESYGLLDINQVRKNVFLNRLSEQSGYLMLSGVKVKAGFADLALNANHADLADYALDSDKWDGRQFADYLDQPLRKTDAVEFLSVVADKIHSKNFVSGFTGSGWKVDEYGNATFDNLTVRKQFNVYELVLNKISGTNGALAVTDSAKVKGVTQLADYIYECEIETDNNTIAVNFAIDDLLRCQVFNGSSMKYIFGKVTAVTNHSFTIFLSNATIAPGAGDTFHRFGNATNANRQGLIYLTSSDANAPYLDVLDGVTSANLDGRTKVRLGKLDGINDADLGALSGYGLYGQNVFVKGKIHVTGGNAATLNNVANAKVEAINLATSQAEADATAKASAAQVAAINAAANDVVSKISALKLGSRNIIKNSKQTLTIELGYVSFDLSEPLIIGETYTATLCGIRGDGAALGMFGTMGNQSLVSFGSATGLQVISNTFVYVGNYGGHSNVRVYSEHSTNPSTFFWAKIEKGNKATDWTPAPEDLTADAQSKADAALASAQAYAAAQAAYEREIAKAYADGKVTAEEASRIADVAAKLQLAKEDAAAKVAAINIGGRNYLSNSDFSNGVANVSPNQYVTITNNSGVLKVVSDQNGSTPGIYMHFTLPLVAGETYTFSMRYKSTVAIQGGAPSTAGFTFPATNDFTIVSAQLIPSGAPTFNYIMLTVPAVGDEMEIDWVKFEKGTKATDWTPAPEDVSSDAQAKATAALSAAQTYAAAQAAYEREIAKAYADGKVTAEEASRIAQAAANLQAAKDDATAKVNAAYALANGYTDTKTAATLTAAQSYADASATSKANVAQANAISQASTDAQNKANAAQAAAALLSQQLVDGVKIGGKNLLKNSKQTVSGINMFLQIPISEPLEPGQTYTATMNGIRGDGAAFALWGSAGYERLLTFGTATGLQTISQTFVYNGSAGNHSSIYVYSENSTNPSTFHWAKIEKGNKATDWTPAPEDVQAAIDLAKSTADAANASYSALTASLKGMAYKDIVSLADLGATIIENGKIKTVLLDADYIRANIVNAGYVNALELDAAAIKSGTIDSARINAAQIISNGGGATISFVSSSITTATSQASADATAKASAAQVAAISAAASDAAAKVAAISIGGRNYITNSDFSNGVANISPNQSVTVTNNSGVLKVVSAQVGSTPGIYMHFTTPLTAGDKYTLTMRIRSTVGLVAFTPSSSVEVLNVTNAFTTASVQLVSSNAETFVYILFNVPAVGDEMEIDWVKFEKGTKATDWTPAPEDVSSDAQAKATAALSAAQTYAAAQAAYEREIAKAYADGKVTAEEASRIAQAAANLQAAKDDATAKVNAAYALANGYTDTKTAATLTAAQSYADASATSKANVAQANAISQASTDAQNKANAAQAAAALLSQQLVDGVKIGGKNLLKNSKQTVSGINMFLQIPISEPLEPGQTYTATMNGIRGNGAAFALWGSAGLERLLTFGTATGLQTISQTFVYNGSAGNHSSIYVYSENSTNPSTFHWAKIEKGNKATDWTPAPEDVQAAIDLAKSTADAANASYSALTASLKGMAYKDIVSLADLGATIIENGKIKTVLLDADYIRSNIVNASYITALDIVATKVAATQGFIGGFNIVNQSLIAGSNSDNPSAWDLDSSNIRLYTDFQLFRKIGGTTSQTDELSINLGYYAASSGLPYKDTLVLKNNIRNTSYPNGGAENPFIERSKNRALVLEAKNSDENIALEVMSGQIYIHSLWGNDHVSNAFKGYVKIATREGINYLVLHDTKPPINSNIPGDDGLFWNDAQTAYSTFGPCYGYDEPSGNYEQGSQHQATVNANTYSSSTSKAAANAIALAEAQTQADNEAANNGYCYFP